MDIFSKYSIFVKLGKRRLVFMLLFGLSFIWCSMIVITLVGHFYPKYYELALIHFNYYSTMSLLPMLVSSIGLFGLFLVGRESSSKMISNIITVFAPSSFGVYLLHCHPLVKDDYIWRIFGCPNWFLSDTLSFVLRMLGSVLAIFVVSLMIDQVRIRMLEKPLLKSGWFNNVCNTVDSIINGLFI